MNYRKGKRLQFNGKSRSQLLPVAKINIFVTRIEFSEWKCGNVFLIKKKAFSNNVIRPNCKKKNLSTIKNYGTLARIRILNLKFYNGYSSSFIFTDIHAFVDLVALQDLYCPPQANEQVSVCHCRL